MSADDFTMDMQRVKVSHTDNVPKAVKITFLRDGIPRELNETFSLQLKPTTNIPTAPNYFFIQDIQLTIVDSDGEDFKCF